MYVCNPRFQPLPQRLFSSLPRLRSRRNAKKIWNYAKKKPPRRWFSSRSLESLNKLFFHFLSTFYYHDVRFLSDGSNIYVYLSIIEEYSLFFVYLWRWYWKFSKLFTGIKISLLFGRQDKAKYSFKIAESLFL